MIGTQVIKAQYQSHVGRVCYFTIATIDRVHKNGNVVIRTNKRGIVVQTYEASHLDDAHRYGDKLARIYNTTLEIVQ